MIHRHYRFYSIQKIFNLFFIALVSSRLWEVLFLESIRYFYNGK